MARRAPLQRLEDSTPLGGARVDVAVRIGWVARMARLTTTTGPRTLEGLAAAVGAAATRIHRLETGRLRDGALLDRYERALDLPAGALRAPVDITCRCYPYGPDDVDASSRHLDVRAVSRLIEQVSEPAPSGGTWLAWARAVSRPEVIGTPEGLVRQLVRRLSAALALSSGHDYPACYEALSLLRCGNYGYLVLEVAQERIAHPHVQAASDLVSAVGENPDREAGRWCLELLDDPRDHVVVAGALGLENMAQVSGRPLFWLDHVGELTRRLGDATPGTDRHQWLTHLVRLVPREVTQQVGTAAPALPAPARAAANSRARASQVDVDWRDCRRRANAVTHALGIPEQPVLARLLYDIAHSPHETRAVTSYMLLNSLPRLSVPAVEHIAALAETHPDPATRERCARRLVGASMHAVPSPVARWLLDPDRDRRRRALRILSRPGPTIDRSLLLEHLREGGEGRAAAIYAAAMSRDPLLAEVASSPEEAARGPATWWLEQAELVGVASRPS